MNLSVVDRKSTIDTHHVLSQQTQQTAAAAQREERENSSRHSMEQRAWSICLVLTANAVCVTAARPHNFSSNSGPFQTVSSLQTI